MTIVRQMTSQDLLAVFTLWKDSEGVTPQDWETPELVAKVIKNFEDLNYVAVHEDQVIGAVLGGYFGLRGLIQHLAVDKKYRRKGIGKQLVDACVEGFKRRDVYRILLGTNNPEAIAFYNSIGFVTNDSVRLMWKDV